MRLTLKKNPSALSQNSSLEYEQLLVSLRSEVAITKKRCLYASRKCLYFSLRGLVRELKDFRLSKFGHFEHVNLICSK